MLENKIFFEWVRKELHLLLLVVLLIPLGISSGITSSTSVYMIGSLSALPADITMASYAYTIGLVIGIPVVLSLKQIITSKNLLLIVFAGLAMIDLVLSLTDQPLILVMGSFLAGFLKIIGLLEIFATLIPILMPKGERYRLYAVYYPATLITAQLATIVAVYAADNYNWQLGQVALMIPLLLGILLVIVFVHPYFPGKKVPIYNFDWTGILLIAISMLLLDYVLSYGLTEDWLQSPKIITAIIFSLLSLALLIGRTFSIQKPALDFSVLKYKNVRFGLIVMFILSLFYAGSVIQNNMMNVILKGNPVEITRINLYLIPGYIAAAIIGYLYYNRYNGFKTMIIIIAVCYVISLIQLYFLTTLSTTSGDFYLPMFFRGIAILLSYMAIGIYVANGLPFLEFFSVSFYYLAIRVFYGPAIWSSFLSYFYYHRLIYNIEVLAIKTDHNNPLYHDMFSNVQSQASMLTVRDTFGMLIMVTLLFIFSLMISTIYQTKNQSGDNGFTLP